MKVVSENPSGAAGGDVQGRFNPLLCPIVVLTWKPQQDVWTTSECLSAFSGSCVVAFTLQVIQKPNCGRVLQGQQQVQDISLQIINPRPASSPSESRCKPLKVCLLHDTASLEHIYRPRCQSSTAGKQKEERMKTKESLQLSRQKAHQYGRNHRDMNVSFIHVYGATARCPIVQGVPRLYCVANPTCVIHAQNRVYNQWRIHH